MQSRIVRKSAFSILGVLFVLMSQQGSAVDKLPIDDQPVLKDKSSPPSKDPTKQVKPFSTKAQPNKIVLPFTIAGIAPKPVDDPANKLESKDLPVKSKTAEVSFGVSSSFPVFQDAGVTVRCNVGRYVPIFVGPKVGANIEITNPTDFRVVKTVRGAGHTGVRYDSETGEVQYDPLVDAKTEGPIFIIFPVRSSVKTTIKLWKNGGDDGPVGTVIADIISGEIKPDPKDDIKPKPDQDDKPKPDVKPKPAVYTGDLLMVVIEETEDSSSDRAKWFTDKELVDYLSKRLARAPRIADQDTVNASGSPVSDLKPYVDIAKREVAAGEKLPYYFCVDTNGVIKLRGSLSKMTPDSFRKLLLGYFGEK